MNSSGTTSLYAKEEYAARKSELRRNNFGAAVGDPIKKDKLYFLN